MGMFAVYLMAQITVRSSPISMHMIIEEDSCLFASPWLTECSGGRCSGD
jgi:hypothetical protein